jgi:hypothetical protein
MTEQPKNAASRFDADTPDEPFALADVIERRYGVPGDPEADERLRADLAAVRDAEREALNGGSRA